MSQRIDYDKLPHHLTHQETVIDFDNYDIDQRMEELHNKRFAMQPAVVAAFRQAGMIGAKRLLDLVADEKKFGMLSVKSQIAILELIFDRAYGRAETASSSAMTMLKTGELDNGKSDHAAQLEAITNRHRAVTAGKQSGGGAVALFPELAAKRRAERRDPEPRTREARAEQREVEKEAREVLRDIRKEGF